MRNMRKENENMIIIKDFFKKISLSYQEEEQETPYIWGLERCCVQLNPELNKNKNSRYVIYIIPS